MFIDLILFFFLSWCLNIEKGNGAHIDPAYERVHSNLQRLNVKLMLDYIDIKLTYKMWSNNLMQRFNKSDE